MSAYAARTLWSGLAFVLLVASVPILHGQTTYYVDGTCGDNAWTGRSPACVAPDGPKATIQAGIDAAVNGDIVIVADGTYMGAGNRRLNFLGRRIVLRSESGPAQCVIDCEDQEPAFRFVTREQEGATLDGFTITGGQGGNSGAVYCTYSWPIIQNCVFIANSANRFGGAINCYYGSPQVRNCVFVGNNAGEVGGAIYCYYSNPTIISSLFVGNGATISGGAIGCVKSNPRIENCTIVENTAGQYGGAIHCRTSDTAPYFANSILWSNSANSGSEIALLAGSSAQFTYCDVAGGAAAAYVEASCTLNWCDGNIDSDPLFIDPAGGDYHLDIGSLCIDSANPSTLGVGQTDLDGEPRVMGGRAEMGVDEFSDRPFVSGDMNCDQARNGADIDPFFLALGDPAAYAVQFPGCEAGNGDCNDDGAFNGADIDVFFQFLGGGACP